MAEDECPIINARKRALRRLTSDPWQTLGIERNASQGTVEAAFRQRMGEAFPDPEGDLTRAYVRARGKALRRVSRRERRRARVNRHFNAVDWGSGSMTVVHSKVDIDEHGRINVRFGNGEGITF